MKRVHAPDVVATSTLIASPVYLRILLLMAACSAIATACVRKDDLIVWKTEVPSPDGQWVASADTVQNGGFGSASIDTGVYLKRTGDSRPQMEVLGFNCQGPVPHPYVLDNAANRGGTINLAMRWITPTHLHVTYQGHPDIGLQVVKYAGIEITLQDLSADGSVERSAH
jgi:hypothetical protein